MSSMYGTKCLTPAQSVAGRIASIFETEADVQSVIVFRGGRGGPDRIYVRPFANQRVGVNLIGVYTREVRIVDLIADLEP